MSSMPSIMVTERTDEALLARAKAGSHIGAVCADAQHLANAKGMPVRFEFNGISVEVNGDELPSAAAARYQAEVAARAKAREESEAGQVELYRVDDQRQAYQAEVDHMLRLLPTSIQNMDALVDWLDRFSEIINTQAVSYDASSLAEQLEAAGYQSNEGVCDGAAMDMDRQLFGRYIVGQVIDTLRDGMGIPPVASSFAKKFARMSAAS